MRFYHGRHRYWCGIDLHARAIYVCILDAEGQVLVHRNLKARPEAGFSRTAPAERSEDRVRSRDRRSKQGAAGKAADGREKSSS